MMHFFVTFALFCLCAIDVKGLRCLVCQDIANPILCTHIAICGANEICGIEKKLDQGGLVKYNLGCRTTKTCTNYNTLTTLGPTKTSNPGGNDTMCQECCNSDICNSAGCGETGYPTDKGPVCFNCENVLNPDQCTNVNVCDQGELCLIEELVEFQVKRYRSKCQRKNLCDALSGGAGPIGKRKRSVRYRFRRASTLCLTCCTSNLCNERCDGINSTTTATTTRSTAEVTTSTTTVPPTTAATTTIPTTTTATTATTISTTATTATATTTSTTTTAQVSSGKKFLLAFMKNYPYSTGRYLEFHITSEISGTLTIKVPYLNIYENKTLQVGENVFSLNETLQANSMVIENKAVYIETTVNVNVYAMNIEDFTSDGFYVIPLDHLSTEYCVATADVQRGRPTQNSEVLVVATENNTSVRFKINTVGSIVYKGHRYNNHRDLVLSLNEYETFQLEYRHELTGTFIIATKPVAVVSGNQLEVEGSHISEMMPPVTSLGKKYIIPTFQSDFKTAKLRVVSTHDDTHINYTISGQTHTVLLKKSKFINQVLEKNDFMFLSSNEPILVSGIIESYDPFMITMIGIDQYLSNYTFAVPSAGFTSYASIVILSSSATGLHLDGQSVNTTCTMTATAFDNDQYCLSLISISAGYHTMYHDAHQSFGLYIYGWRSVDAYGYFAGMKF